MQEETINIKQAAEEKKTAEKTKPAKKKPAAAKKTTGTSKTSNKSTKKTVHKGGTLVIVESPAKAHTIGKFLGKGYSVTASQGHVRDLPAKQLGVDIEHDFEPKYVQMQGKSSIVSTIKSEAKSADHVLLATDPDREGEAISWHIAHLLKMDQTAPCRIEFHEITQHAVQEALKHPRPIDMGKVDAQQARRVLDRLVGYKLSPILWKKVRKGLSAGRVQSVAVSMVCKRDKEIAEFVPQEYWTIGATFVEQAHQQSFEARLEKIRSKKAEIATQEEADSILSEVKQQEYTIASVKKGKRSRKAPPPFTTSTLQQEASRKLNLSPANTMRIAQALYEGVEIQGQGAVGLLTYIRTDSVRVSQEAIGQVRGYIEEKYGKEYLPDKPNYYKNRRSAQDAHEAIRPTSVFRTPQSLKGSLNRDQMRLYELVYNRFVASQMTPEISDTITADVVGGAYTFRTSSSIVRFDGYRIAYTEGRDDEQEEQEKKLPELAEGVACNMEAASSAQHFTQPLPHFTEATLVKALEEKGIGRPSTYATIISTIVGREYVVKEQKQLLATQLGFVVTDLLEQNFKDIVNEAFTAHMEEELDDVEEGEDWRQVIREFYTPFEKSLEAAEKNIQRVKLPEEVTDIPCEKCGAMMVVKTGRFGKFLACPNYPECKNTKPYVEDTGATCPKCGAKVVKRKSKNKKTFYGCENYPECDFISWDLPAGENCPECGSYMVVKWGKNKRPYRQCSNSECNHREFGLKGKSEENKDEQ